MATLSAAASPFCRPEEDPFLLLESALRSVQEILLRRRGGPLRRTWIEQPYGEEEISLLEEEVFPQSSSTWRALMSSMGGCWRSRSCCSAAIWKPSVMPLRSSGCRWPEGQRPRVPQVPDGVAPMSLLVIRCRESDVPPALELATDLAPGRTPGGEPY